MTDQQHTCLLVLSDDPGCFVFDPHDGNTYAVVRGCERSLRQALRDSGIVTISQAVEVVAA